MFYDKMPSYQSAYFQKKKQEKEEALKRANIELTQEFEKM